MGSRNGPYNEDFPAGTLVRIRDLNFLSAFRDQWRWHHPLDRTQMDFAGQRTTIRRVSFYHGGDELYELDGIPGIWHEQCLDLDGH